MDSYEKGLATLIIVGCILLIMLEGVSMLLHKKREYNLTLSLDSCRTTASVQAREISLLREGLESKQSTIDSLIIVCRSFDKRDSIIEAAFESGKFKPRRKR
jgi:hypothetical protein